MESVLPTGWTWATLQDLVLEPQDAIVSGPFGSNLKASEYVDMGIPVIRLQNIDRDRFIPQNIPFISEEKAEQLSRHTFIRGDIVITKLGDPLGKACLVPNYLERGIIVADVVRVRVDEQYVLKKYLVHCINSELVIKSLAAKMNGMTRPRVKLSHIRKIEIPLAPLAEQQRIVDEIEKQFTRLEMAVSTFQKVLLKLERLRAAILKAACEGKLVPQDPNNEPADILLQRILEERRCKWEEEQWAKQIEKAKKKAAKATRKAAGKPLKRGEKLADEEWQNMPESTYSKYLPKNDEWKQKYKEPAHPDITSLPELPIGWAWVNTGQMVEVGTGATPLRSNSAYYLNGTIPWVTSSVVNKPFVDSATEFITDLAVAETNAKIFPTRTLLIAMYGEGKTRGKVTELRIHAATNQACAALIFDTVSQEYQPYLKLFFENNYEKLRGLASGGVQPNLNLSIIRETPIPLPPLAESKRIVCEVETRLSIIEYIKNPIAASLIRAERLRQSILKKAFSGTLVPQDPTDEPATVLLQRIREEREKRAQEEKAVKPKRQKGVRVKKETTRRSLYELLVQAEEPISAVELFHRAGFKPETIDEFYEELRKEVPERIKEIRPNKADVYLKAVVNET